MQECKADIMQELGQPNRQGRTTSLPRTGKYNEVPTQSPK